MESVLNVPSTVRNVQEPLTSVPNVFPEETSHQIVTVHQDNTKQKTPHVLTVTGNVLNVLKPPIHVPHVEETEKSPLVVNVQLDITNPTPKTVPPVLTNVPLVK